MKKLLLALLIFLGANTLSAFDKVWELQFSSAPHHVHYTEGHKELIVGEGNTFKKYNAETGVLLDSVVYSFDALKNYTIGGYHVTDDLKYAYLILDTTDYYKVVKYNLKTWTIDKYLFSVLKSDRSSNSPNFYSIKYFVQISNDNYLLSVKESVMYSLRANEAGYLYTIINDNLKNIDYGQTEFIGLNTFNNSLILISSIFRPYYGYPSRPDYYNRSCFYWDTAKIINLPVTYGIGSETNKYIYYLIDSNGNDLGYIKRYSFDNALVSNYIGKDYRNIVQFGNDDELIMKKNNITYHYNFKVNTFLDSIDLGGNYQYITDLNNNLLLSIVSNKVTAYKSGFSSNKVISKLKDTLIIKSISDIIALNAISNLNPIKEEWDLGDGRKWTRDTARFAYTKSGEYIVKYTATYIDTVVRHTCTIKVYNFDYDYVVNFKKGYTELILNTRLEGNFATLKTKLTQPDFVGTFTTYDSSSSRIIYRLYQGGIYNINFNISYIEFSNESNVKLILPIMKVDNTSYEYENLLNMYNFSLYKNHLYMLNYTNSLVGIENVGTSSSPYYFIRINIKTEMLYINNYKIDLSNFIENQILSNTNPTSSNDWKLFAAYFSKDEVYKLKRIFNNYSNIFIQNNDKSINIFEKGAYNKYKMPIVNNINPTPVYYSNYIKENKDYYFLCYYIDNTTSNSKRYFSYSIDDNDGTISEKVKLSSNYYDDIAVFSDTKNKLMLSSVKDLKVFSINNNFRILDTLMTEKYNRVFAKSINGNYAFAIIDTSSKDTNQYLKVMDIKNKKSKLVKLDNTVKYHQVYQVNDSITCLMGRKDKDLVIETFKNSLMYFSAFKIEHSGIFTILEKTDDNELHLSFVDTSIPASNLIKTKGFASIFNFVSKTKDTTKIPFDSTAFPIDIIDIRIDTDKIISIDTTINPIDTTENPIDTTKNKGIIYNKDNQFGSVIQDPDFKSAKIYFKDSLDLSNSFVKIFTETGEEILTYSLSSDQKELPIRTDKLYHGTYYVRLSKNGEEYNLGKFIIVR